ncbi:MAG: glycosyltransferase family 4 protein, partial [Chloroflexi bacterium]|nr:glycosyltransferase family 4 protein [Chloroflexota bacterium]
IIADLVYLLQNTAVRQQITVGAKEHIATHFNWKKLANHLEAVYEQG